MKIPAMLTALLGLLGVNLSAEPLAVGASAPRITAPDENGKPLDLGRIYDQGLVLVYFYPKAGTSGCTAQACSLRDAISDLKDLGIIVVGVSHDTPEAQLAFKQKNELPFSLIADSDGAVIRAFGVPTLIGGISMRQSFLIRDGKVVWRSLKAQTASHADEVRQAVAALK